jgi:hypothetical protein
MEGGAVVGVYLPNQGSQTGPRGKVSREHATDLVKRNLAGWINRGRAIRLSSYNEKLHGDSCTMGQRVIEANAGNARWAKALVTNSEPQELETLVLKAIISRAREEFVLKARESLAGGPLQ